MLYIKKKKNRISETFSGYFSGHSDEKCKKYWDEDLLVAVSNSHAEAPFIIAKEPRCYDCTVTVNMISNYIPFFVSPGIPAHCIFP